MRTGRRDLYRVVRDLGFESVKLYCVDGLLVLRKEGYRDLSSHFRVSTRCLGSSLFTRRIDTIWSLRVSWCDFE